MSTGKRLQKFISFLLALSIFVSQFTAIGFSAPPQIDLPFMDGHLNGIPKKEPKPSTPSATPLEALAPAESPVPTPSPATELYVQQQNTFVPVATTPPNPTTTRQPTPSTETQPIAIVAEITTVDSPFSHPFPDISGHWAENTIMYLNDRGIINKYPDGSLRPNSPITRGEFAYSLSNWLEVNSGLLKELGYAPPAINASFNDITGSPFAGEINRVASQGLMSGGDKSFRPNDNITREETGSAWVNLFKTLTKSSLNEEYFNSVNQASVLGRYSDSGNISATAKQAVAVMTAQDFMTGYPDGTFRPQGEVTRAEAYTIISKIELDLKKQVQSKQPANESADRPDQMELVRVYAKNLNGSGFDLELTVNNTAAELNPYVLLAYTNDVDKHINETNIGKEIYGVKTRKVKLNELTNVSSFAYQSIYSANINVSFPNTYYAYAMLHEEELHSDVKHCVVYVNDLTEERDKTEPVVTETETVTTSPGLIVGRIEVEKIDGEGAPLSGAEFELKDDVGIVVANKITPEDGKIIFENLAMGIYSLLEISPPQGYENSGYQETVTLTEAEREALLTVTNLKTQEPEPEPEPEPKPEPENGKLTVIKVDADSKDLLDGALFELKSIQDDTVAESVTSGESLTVYEDLYPGNYWLSEIESPVGYQPVQDPIYVTIDRNGDHEIEVPNYMDIPLLVRKVDSGDPTLTLPGASFRLRGDDIDLTGATGADGTVIFSGLGIGSYTLTETEAPQGYVLDGNPKPVEITQDNLDQMVEIEVKNEKEPDRGTLLIQKVDQETNQRLPGAIFTLEDSNGVQIGHTRMSDYNGLLEFTGLAYGTYTLTETRAPDWYIAPEENPLEVIIDSPSTVITVKNLYAGIEIEHEYDYKIELWWEANSPTDLDMWVYRNRDTSAHVGYSHRRRDFSSTDILWLDFDHRTQGPRSVPEFVTSLGNRDSTLSVVVHNFNNRPLTEDPVLKIYRQHNGVETLVKEIGIDLNLLSPSGRIQVCNIVLDSTVGETVTEILAPYPNSDGGFQ